MPPISTFTSIINQLLPEPHAGLLSGILFGVKASLDPELKEALVTTGTLHIIALSGMNIMMLMSIVNISLLSVLSRKIAALVTVGVIIVFILFVGPSASIVRAGIMGSISCIAFLFGKRTWALWSWGVTVILMLAVKPLWITDLSFQLSVLASLGMIVFERQTHETLDIRYQTEERRQKVSEIRKWRDAAWSAIFNDLHETLAAQSLTILILLYSFGRLSLVSPLTNVLIVWTIPIITVLGFLLCITGYFFLPFAHVFAWSCWIFLEYVIHIITMTAKIPWASIEF